jgi:hypothetical protein
VFFQVDRRVTCNNAGFGAARFEISGTYTQPAVIVTFEKLNDKKEMLSSLAK